jgi:hypothetical protein
MATAFDDPRQRVTNPPGGRLLLPQTDATRPDLTKVNRHMTYSADQTHAISKAIQQLHFMTPHIEVMRSESLGGRAELRGYEEG